MDIDIRTYIAEIHAVLERSGLVGDIEIVPNIREWCEKHGVPEENSSRAGKIVRHNQTGRYVILLPERITSAMVDSVVDAMEWRGFGTEVAQLADRSVFVRHLTLHEIAHGLDDTRTEAECDEWAFQQLREWSSEPMIDPDVSKSDSRGSR